MTCRVLDSMETYASQADVTASANGWSGSPGPPVTSGGRWGTGYVPVTVANSSVGISRTFTPGLGEWIVGWVARFTSIATGQAHLRFLEAATLHCDLRFDASGHAIVTRNGTLLATGTRVFATGVDYVLDLRIKFHDTTGTVALWVDDVQDINATGLDTRNGGTGLVDIITWLNASNQIDRLSEVYIFDTAGSVNNTRAGSYRISTRRGSAAGNYAQWTPSASTNVSNIDDANGNDGDTTYNSSSTATQIDSFQMGAIPPTGGTVLAIKHHLVARKDDAGVREIAPFQRQSSTDYVETTVTMTTTFAHYEQIKETNPSTSAAYTVAEMRATSPEFGYKEIA